MSECRRTVDRLASYVDRLLPPPERAEVERHLVSCSHCRITALTEEGGRAVLREKAASLKSEPLPPGLRSRCEALAREHARQVPAAVYRNGSTPFLGKSWRLFPVFMTAVLTLFIATVVFSLATHQSDTLLAAQLTADHSKCFGLFAGPEAPIADATRLEQMLLDDYGWTVHVPPSSPAVGVQLIGARRCLYADGRIPHVMYRVNGEDLSLFVLTGVARNDSDVTALGHRSRMWSRGGTTYVLVAPTAAGELTDAVRYIMSEAH
jgi:anti-sigma factor RsiW